MVKITWFGHATWLIDTGNHKALIDPFFDHNPSSPVKAKDVSADFILITHGHEDHIADAASIANRCQSKVISNYEIALWLAKRHGVQDTVGMNLGGSLRLPLGIVKSTIAYHSSSLPDGSYGGNPGGFLLTLPSATIYIAGDTALFGDMERIGATKLDLAILPIGDLFTMGPDDALEAIKLLKPKRFVASHYNTWPPIDQDATALADRVRKETSTTPIVLKPSQSFEFGALS